MVTFPMFGDGIFTQEGDSWKHSRDLLRPQLVYRQYENLDLFEEPMNDLLGALPKNGGVVDLQPLFFRYALDVTTAFLFGESIHSLKTADGGRENAFASSFDLAQQYVAKRFRLQDFHWLIGGKEFRQACQTVHDFADQIIDQNLSPDSEEKESSSRYVFLKSVAQACPDRELLRGQIINILAAGRDTTACLLSWTL